MTAPLRVVCADLEAPPLFWTAGDGDRAGLEPAITRLVAARLEREVEWVYTPWSAFYPAIDAGRGDVVWCGQGITEERQRLVDFTEPYAIFNESVLTRPGAGVAGPEDLVGRRVAAIAGSANMLLARTFTGAEIVGFDGASDDVFGDMLGALRDHVVDAVVDDDVVLVPLDADPAYELAFTVETRNPWGVALPKGSSLRQPLDDALRAVKADGSLQALWERELPSLPYPFQVSA
ncbi:substrate-binding periplasmic protein [Nitriliruptor alkaliphilus]|uniref:substrate-binding periplasmic protein n=1 Tax=Nitriliruptor alkaliphilus TaxID=427918 RepID=UPI000698B50C|nr:ABC transporter substrate-binding protein [Nitriliruptor alkaliphilus]